MASRRFLFVSVDAPPKTGGVALLATELSRHMAAFEDAGQSVFLGPKGTCFARTLNEFQTYEDLQSDIRLRAGPGCQLEDDRIEDLIIRIVTSYDLNEIVLWHPYYYGPGAIRAARACAIPVSVFVHGTELTSQCPGVLEGPLEACVEPSSLKLPDRLIQTLHDADRVLTNSTFSAGLVRNAVPNRPVSSVGCGIDARLLEQLSAGTSAYSRGDRAARRQALGLSAAPMMIAVGRLVPHKNHKQMVSLLASMPEWQLVIIGDGPSLDPVLEAASAKGVRDRLSVLSDIADEDKFAYMQAADLGLLISTYDHATGGYEGYGIVMLEYAAAGCVPVTTGAYGMSDFSDYRNAAITTLNSDDPIAVHAGQLHDAALDEAQMHQRVQECRRIIAEDLTWGRVAARTLAALEA